MSSKRKKAAKLKRVMAAVKKQSRKEVGKQQSFAAIQLLHDPQVPHKCPTAKSDTSSKTSLCNAVRMMNQLFCCFPHERFAH